MENTNRCYSVAATGTPRVRFRTAMRPRSHADLLRELEEEATASTSAALVMLLPEDVRLVWSDAPGRSGELQSLLASGGIPAAVVRVGPERIESRSFCEHAGDEETEARVAGLLARLREKR